MSTASVINMTGLSIPSHEISHPQHTTTHTQPTSPTGSTDEPLSPIINCMIAGGFGGAIGDSVMHSLDTVKTRQQGSPNTIKYRNMISAYSTIFREEGLRRGLYGGYGAAMLGSFPSTAIFFGTYEGTKRVMIDTWGINETLTHLTAGFLGDFASSVVYVPSEVLKTRLQLQGQFNNPHFNSGYNYRGLTDAIKTLIAKEGAGTLFFGYKATLCRDLPFSALQFAFYEKFRDWAFFYNDLDSKKGDDLSITFELLTGAAAGGLAGSITTPLDVIKTRIQTQNPSSGPVTPSATHVKGQPVILQTGSVLKGLSIVYRTEGVSGLFSGVGPRFVWTSIQSSIMLLLYQVALRNLNDLLGNGKDQF